MQTTRQIKWDNSLVTLLGSGVAAYVILKIVCLGITDDEAWSYFNVKHFWYVEALCTGNTHWFNFLAIKAALLLGFEKAWQLRWFTALSSLTFIFIGILWIKEIKSTHLKLLAFTCLFLNPYLLDYLSLARGYANSLAFMALSLLFLYKSLKMEHRKAMPSLALLFAGLSAIANFNFFYYFTAFSALYFINFYFKNGFSCFKNKKFYIEIFYAIGIAGIVLRALLFITKCSNDIGGCGGEQLIESMFGSFMVKVFATTIATNEIILMITTYSFFIIILMACGYGIYKNKPVSNNFYTWISFIVLGMLLLTVINKWCFNVLYPIHRTTLMFFPLFIIALVSFADKLNVPQIITYLISLAFATNFLMTINLNRTQDYQRQADSKLVYESLINLKAKKVGICPELYVLYLKYYSSIYPDLKGEMINTIMPIPVWLQQQQNNTLTSFDYLILYPPYDVSYYKGSNLKLEGISLLPQTKTLIAKVKH